LFYPPPPFFPGPLAKKRLAATSFPPPHVLQFHLLHHQGSPSFPSSSAHSSSTPGFPQSSAFLFPLFFPLCRSGKEAFLFFVLFFPKSDGPISFSLQSHPGGTPASFFFLFFPFMGEDRFFFPWMEEGKPPFFFLRRGWKVLAHGGEFLPLPPLETGVPKPDYDGEWSSGPPSFFLWEPLRDSPPPLFFVICGKKRVPTTEEDGLFFFPFFFLSHSNPFQTRVLLCLFFLFGAPGENENPFSPFCAGEPPDGCRRSVFPPLRCIRKSPSWYLFFFFLLLSLFFLWDWGALLGTFLNPSSFFWKGGRWS